MVVSEAVFKHCPEVSVVTFIYEVMTPRVAVSVLVCLFLGVLNMT